MMIIIIDNFYIALFSDQHALSFTKTILWYKKTQKTTRNNVNKKSNNIQAKMYVKTNNIHENNVHEKVTIYRKIMYMKK